MKSVITASFAAVVAVLVLGSHTGHAAPYTYSAAATSSDFFESFNVLVQDTNSAGPAFAEVGSAPALYAKARTAYGVNQAAWQATGQSDQVGALSI